MHLPGVDDLMSPGPTVNAILQLLRRECDIQNHYMWRSGRLRLTLESIYRNRNLTDAANAGDKPTNAVNVMACAAHTLISYPLLICTNGISK